MDTAVPYLQARSPLNVVDRINQNGTAVLMATSWNDLAYGTDQITDFYTRLTGPKRLEVRPGDHVVNEVPGSVGIGDPAMYGHLFDWMTTYVGGIDTPLVHQAPVWMQPRSSAAKPAPETYASWEAVTTGSQTYGLTGRTGWFQPTGGMTTGTGAPWSQTITKGLNVVGGLGAPIIGFAGEALGGTPPQNALGLVDRASTGIWKGPALTAPLALRGQSTLRVTVTPSRSEGTIVVYLYDASGSTSYLIAHRPWSFSSAVPGKPIQLTLPLQPTAYTLPAGHRLAVGISTGDPLYGNENPDGATIGLSSAAAFPASLTVSTGG
jgi:predicted acyl esterase